MRITFNPRAAVELETQIDYLIERDALVAAARLKARCDEFFEKFLARHPRTGRFIADRQIWEMGALHRVEVDRTARLPIVLIQKPYSTDALYLRRSEPGF